MAGSWKVPGAAPGLFLESGPALLRTEDQVLESMIGGWRDQQLSRNLNGHRVSRTEVTDLELTERPLLRGLLSAARA